MTDTIQNTVPDAIREGAILLRLCKGENAYKGLVEESFAMNWSDKAVRFWWSGTAYSIIGTHELNGFEDAESQRQHYQSKYPEDTFVVFDIRDPNLPIVIDWEQWLANGERSESDRRRWSKYVDRNPSFKMKD